MKRIVKSDDDIQRRIDSWVARAKKRNQADWNHFSRDKAGNGIHMETKTYLINEQGSICCYCERRVAVSSCHTEHFRGKGRYPERMFDYGNLHASCNGFPDEADHCCGHKRAQQGNPDIPISPLDDDCESRFRFTGFGSMKATNDEDQGAADTIDALGLDSPKLRGMRRSLMFELEGCVKGMSREGFADYVDSKLQVDDNGQFAEFFTTIRQYADELRGCSPGDTPNR